MNNSTNDVCCHADGADKERSTPAALTWSVLQLPGSRSDVIIRHLAAICVNAVSYGTAFAIFWEIVQTDTGFRNQLIAITIASTAFYIKMMRQKTAYHYRVLEDKAVLDRHVYYSKFETSIIKSITVICMLGFLGVALFTGSLFVLVGPAAIGLIAGLRLLNFKIPITHEDSLPWSEYNFVTVDRKRKIIVTHYSDLTLGFEARLPDDKLFEQYLDLVKKSLPATAQFTEKEWKHDLI